MRLLPAIAALAVWTAVVFVPFDALAFCGFFVSGADAKLTNDASQVVLMRDGTRTVLSMQNDYAGPPENFALVVPVPVVLQESNVRTLSKDVFDHVDSMGAPRLVEYWEQDPCPPESSQDTEGGTGTRAKGEEGMMGNPSKNRFGSRVTIEAKFAVGEYEILILGAKDSAGLEGWLREEHYAIPEGAEPLLRPYVAAGSKFFVAKVDVKKVKFDRGRLRLSPLRFHYDADTFTLPIRLGLLNSPGTQDIVVSILATDRYEVANYPNVLVPTNIDVDDSVRTSFPRFYAALFDKTLEKNPRAVVTEYAWSASSCDPCPSPPLEMADLAILGSDVLPKTVGPYDLTLSRLHARYGKAALGDDLVFRAAKPIVGGREDLSPNAILAPPSKSTFQARYAIRHLWQGPIRCRNPIREVWGGPPDGVRATSGTKVAKDLATADRSGLSLAAVVRSDVPDLGIVAERPGGLPSRFRVWRFAAAGAVLGLVVMMLLLGAGGRKGLV